MMSNTSTINFPPGTITSKLSSRKLKKPPSPKDWMHQTYMQMIQDVSYATSHYYESIENGNHLLFDANNHNNNKVCPDKFEETHCQNKNAASLNDTTNKSLPPLPTNHSPFAPYQELIHTTSSKGKENVGPVAEEERYGDDESGSIDDEYCNTYTTSSTDCNRRNNIYRFYREQQGLKNPIDEESSVIKIVTPYNSSNNTSEVNCSSNSNNNYYDDEDTITTGTGSIITNSSSIVTQDNINGEPQHDRNSRNKKKKFKLLKNMMTKMKLAAEKPFWAIDSHF